jgi:alpha-D-ribose 1-methylphosphonate 5-phosphate C-P lyase
MHLRVVLWAMLTGSCHNDGIPEPCLDLEVYFNECCDLCGPQDSYCSMIVIDDRRLCREELQIWDDQCFCD